MSPHKHKNNGLRRQKTLSILLALLLLTPQSVGQVFASTWSPTMLVNTEAFQIIDDTNTTANIVLRFGDTVNKNLTYERTAGRFSFDASLYVQGNAGVTGTLSGSQLLIYGSGAFATKPNSKVGIGTALPKAKLSVIGTISGSTVYATQSFSGAGLSTCSNTTNSKLLWNSTTGRFSCGTDQTGAAGGGSFGSGNVIALGDPRYVKKQGDTMTGALSINTSVAHTATGAFNIRQMTHATGAIIDSDTTKEAALAIDIVGTSRAPHLLFGYQGTFDTNLYRAAAQRLQTDGNLFVLKTLSGSAVHGEKSLSSSGTPMLPPKCARLPAASGSSLYVSGSASFSGPLTFGDLISDAIVVNASTWTFANDTNFVLNGGVNGLSFDTSTFSVDAFNDRIGINTIAPKTRLEVVGTISGSLLRASNMTVSGAVVYSSGNTLMQNAKGASGQILISQATSAPKWATPLTSMVWYLDNNISPGTNQGPVVIMPYGLLVSTGSLRIKGAPTGSDLIIDIRKDNVSIFSTKPKILAGQTIGGKNMVLSTTNLTAGSEITVSVDQTGSTFSGSGLTIMLSGTRKY